MLPLLDDYMDADVAYLAGLIIGRGTLSEIAGVRQLTIEFSYSSLEAHGIHSTFPLETAIKLGLDSVRERLQELLDTDIRKVPKSGAVDLVIRFMRNSMVWRNILLLTDGATSYPFFRVPRTLLSSYIPVDWKREFVRGYADVAGNIRHANRYVDGRNRVRLDVPNYPSNWDLPVQLCTLLQDHLDVPVQLITWGHPDLRRDFREHQLNMFAEPFLKIGFSLEHKQQILQEYATWDAEHFGAIECHHFPGMRRLREKKPVHPEENNQNRLDSRLVGQHYDQYWQICKALGCTRIPTESDDLELQEHSNTGQPEHGD